MADTFASPRGSDSLAVVIEQIGRLDRREGAREIIRRVALRAGVELDPAACWLLARLRAAPVSLSTLAERAHVEAATLDRATDRLLELGLIAPGPDAASSHEPAAAGPDATLTYELTAAGHSTLERLTSTGEERLRDLLECWRPDRACGSRPLDRQPRARVLHRRLGPAQGHPGARGGSRLLSECGK